MTQHFVSEDMAFTYLAERYNEPLDESRKLTIGNNLAMFFSILNEWSLQDEPKKENLECIEDASFNTNDDSQIVIK